MTHLIQSPFQNKKNSVVAVLIANTLVFSPYVAAIEETEYLLDTEFLFERSVPSISPKKDRTLVKRVSNQIDWLVSFYESASTAALAKDVYPVVKGIRDLFSKNSYDVVDDILAELDVAKLSHTALVTFLTTTYPARNKLQNWTLAAHLVKVKLETDGLNSDDVLHGLI